LSEIQQRVQKYKEFIKNLMPRERLRRGEDVGRKEKAEKGTTLRNAYDKGVENKMNIQGHGEDMGMDAKE
jgi:hypothetical protein